MLSKFNINIDELKSNIDGIKSMVNKKKTYRTIGQKTLNKHIDLDENNTIQISIDVNVTVDENGNEIVVNSKNVDQILLNIAQSIVKNTTENMIMPKSVIVSSDEHVIDKLEYANMKKEYEDIDLDIVNIEKPRCTMAEVVLNEYLRKGVSRILAINKNKGKIVNEMNIQNSLKLGNSVLCNFYGESGSGKSSVIHSIANELNKNIVTLNYNLLEAIPNHNIPKMVKFVFEIAKKQNAVVVIEECDRLIKEKNPDSSDYSDNKINIVESSIKNEMGKFDSIIFFTSTNKDKIDEHFSRLFFISVEFKNPDYYEREKLWKLYINENVKLSPMLDYKTLAQKYQDISRADIRDILFVAASIALEDNRDVLYEMDFDKAYDQILGRY